MSAPLQFLAWEPAGPAASSAVLSSKCLLTWTQRCLSFGMGPGDESSGASAGNAVLGGHRAKQSCWPTPHPCSKAAQQGGHPLGPVVFGVAKQGNGTPKLGNQRLDEAGGFIVRVQASRAVGVDFHNIRFSEISWAGLAIPVLLLHPSNGWPHTNCQPGTSPGLCYLPNHVREWHSSGLL